MKSMGRVQWNIVCMGILFLMVTFALSAQKIATAQEGARLYIDFSTTQAQKTFDILSEPLVQKDLQLTTNQITKIAGLNQQRLRSIPSLTNLLEQLKTSKDEETRRKTSDDLWRRFGEYQLNSLFNILSTGQSNRFQQILWQVDGLKSLKHDYTLDSMRD